MSCSVLHRWGVTLCRALVLTHAQFGPLVTASKLAAGHTERVDETLAYPDSQAVEYWSQEQDVYIVFVQHVTALPTCILHFYTPVGMDGFAFL